MKNFAHNPVRTAMEHGGDMRRLAQQAGRSAASLIDFSVNIRPEGPPEFIRAALWRAMERIETYPSPHGEEAVTLAAAYLGLDDNQVVFGNGSNELIHALARVLAQKEVSCVCVIEPAFSEYALACTLAGLSVRHLSTSPDHHFVPLWESLLERIPQGAAVFWANPGNPSGCCVPCERLVEVFDSRPDVTWIVDEAFIEYVQTHEHGHDQNQAPGHDQNQAPGHDQSRASLLSYALREQWVVLRSLTKFHALPGVRLGYAVAGKGLACALRAHVPAWTVNAFALAAACAVFSPDNAVEALAYTQQTRTINAQRRAHLTGLLQQHLEAVPGFRVFASQANYVLFQCPSAPPHMAAQLLINYGLAVRDCSNYPGLEQGGWYRVAVRFERDHEALIEALLEVLKEPVEKVLSTVVPRRRGARHTPALMIQGTSSNAGKSVLAAAFGRILQQDGYSVAPFKAQNMSLNSGVTVLGHEMGRAQMVQAQACRVEPHVRMNPILLKPHSDTGSQVIVMGKAVGHMDVRAYFAAKKDLWSTVTHAYDELATEHEVLVLEGAGSPGEINLKDSDLVNMTMARHAKASVLLVGDIDRGGVYASFLGTWMTFSPEERRLLTGFVVNRFRGEPSLLQSAHIYMERRTGVPVLGVVPYLRHMNIPEEDMGFSWGSLAEPDRPRPGLHALKPGVVDVAVLALHHASNTTDFAPLQQEPDVRVRLVRSAEAWGTPDVVMVPGSKSVVADLRALRQQGFEPLLRDHVARGQWLVGICGGFQMLGYTLADPHGIESSSAVEPGLELLPVDTTFGQSKLLVRVENAQTPFGVPVSGYEIHHGETLLRQKTFGNNESAWSAHAQPTQSPDQLLGTSRMPSHIQPLFRRANGEPCGYGVGHVWGTYLHGLFDNDAFRRAFVDHVRVSMGLAAQGQVLAVYDLEQALDRLANVVRENVNMKALYASLGLA